jgi:hypothetical protein
MHGNDREPYFARGWIEDRQADVPSDRYAEWLITSFDIMSFDLSDTILSLTITATMDETRYRANRNETANDKDDEEE